MQGECSITTLGEHACFGGVQGYYRHDSEETGTPMKFGMFVPPQAKSAPVPVLFFLAGLTCSEETFTIKAGAQQHAALHGLMLVTPDTSPRGTGVEGADAAWDFGTAAGHHLDATAAPWNRHWRMGSYVRRELRALVLQHFNSREDRVGLCGHSMGGHDATELVKAGTCVPPLLIDQASRSRCAATKAATTATFSSRPSWPTTSRTMRACCTPHE